MMYKTILVVDDEEGICLSLKGILSDEGYDVLTAESGEECLRLLDDELPDLILLDIWLPGMDGIEVLKVIKARFPQIQIIMMSGHGTIESAVKATKLGAFDFIEKPLSLEKIVLLVAHALEMARLEEENRLLKDRMQHEYELTGTSREIEELREMIQIISPTNAWVLIMGENGTGKELVARSIHRQSKKSEAPFVEVNCAAIPEELIESELFGHEKGAFTGATAKKRGKFEMADGGTLFLDEVADMSLKAQAKILRILQEKKFERVGGTRFINVEVRVLAATNKDLEKEMEEGRFRQDLYYRLHVIPLYVPPLRTRKEDVAALVHGFLKEFSAKEGIPEKYMTEGAIELLKTHDWPGNVRELKNVIERLVILTPSDLITEEDLPFLAGRPMRPLEEVSNHSGSLREAKADFEKSYIVQKLEESDWNVTKTAKILGLERSNLHRKIRAYGLDSKKGETNG